MRIAVIVNPFSGSSRTGKRVAPVKQALEKIGIAADIFLTGHQSPIADLCRRINPDRYHAIAAMGGDGTNFDMINGLMSTFCPDQLPPLAILPSGSGNSFVKDLGVQTLDQGIAAIAANQPRPVDLIRFCGESAQFYFINVMGLGFATDVALTAQRFKFFGDFSYLFGVFHRTAQLSFYHMELKIDNDVISGPNCFVEFCNSRYTGGSMLMAPRAKIDDGLVDIIIARPVSKIKLLTALPRIFAGTHIGMEEVTYRQGKRIEIRAIPAKSLLPDGEITGHTPGTLEVLPRQLRYMSLK